ncbi:MAG: hypothetical protein KZQ95_01335 [Candidatus Thiodiazotropha sp. (ex Epidulcina cf. delphinae)]|nr:hypothetical protein [Candidatus Thiodiazotropha sp. (ex Epidulcina cf. delphinae)]
MNNNKPRRFNIPLETLLEAKKCTKHHACLTDSEYELCGIRITVENQARMVCDKGADCSYRFRLGNEIVCTCPVRHAIHSKYNI